MKNNKGFTLVELLVTIAIFGIIVGMSIPLIGNIKQRNNQRKYDVYGQAMLASSKVYKNDYGDDLFGHKNSGCAVVTLHQLIEKKIIKDFPDKNITCDDPNNDSKVQIVKINKKYGYSYQLKCDDNSDGIFDLKSWSFSKRANLSHNDDSAVEFDSCDVSGGMDIIANPSMESEPHDDYKIKLYVSSSTGINPNSPISLEYAWVSLDTLDQEVTDFLSITGWKSIPALKVPTKKKQLNMILATPSEIVKSSDHIIHTPNEMGYYMLVIKVNNFQDLAGEQYPDKYKAIGAYNVSKTYKITYEDTGETSCPDSQVHVSMGDNQKTLGDLCFPEKDGFIFLRWKDEYGDVVDKDTKIVRDMTLKADWEIIKSGIQVYYKVDSGDSLTTTTTASNGVDVNTWSKDENGLVMRSVNGGESKLLTTAISPGKNITINLPNYNNSSFLKITKNGYYGIKGKEWICESGCKQAGQTFTHDSLTIADTNNICDSNEKGCSIVLKVNWGNKPYCNSDGNCFDTFQTAINSTGTGKIIYLMKDNNDTGGGIFNKNRSLKYDGLGHQLNLKDPIQIANGTVTLTNGTIVVSASHRRAIECSGGVLNINDANNKAITIQSDYHTNTYMGAEAILVKNSRVNIQGSKTTIKDGKGSSSAYARVISVEDNGRLYMYNGTLVSDATNGSQGGVGINAEKGGTVEITGGTVHITKMDKHNRCVFCSSERASFKIKKVKVKVDVGKTGNIFWGTSTTSYFCYQKGSNVVLTLPKGNNYIEKTSGSSNTYNVKTKC